MTGSHGWIDVSAVLDRSLVSWPGDGPFVRERVAELSRGDSANVSQLRMSAHAGTHVDAPCHYLPGGSSIAEVPLDAVMGRAVVIGISNERAICPGELERCGIEAGTRVLFKTRNSERAWSTAPFTEEYVHLTPQGAEWLARRDVLAVGIDYLSIGAVGEQGDETHRVLLRAGIWIIEGLQLSGVCPGIYEMACLPLRIADCDGAPARVVLRGCD